MGWCEWTLAGLIGLPVAALVGGVLTVAFMLIWPMPPREVPCGGCSRVGPWVRRNSVGFRLCETCAGPGAEVKP